jgi:hypothetical protein
MEKNKKVKLYCYIYRINDNQVYRQNDIAEFHKGAYFIHDENDETIYVDASKIDVPKVSEDEDDKFIYVYSLDNDVNKAMDLIHASIQQTLDELNKKASTMQGLLNAFEEKQEYIKNKYPKGNENPERIEDLTLTFDKEIE